MVRERQGRPQLGRSIYQCANCGKSCNGIVKHTNIEYGVNFFCNHTCKLNWIYVQFKGSKLRGILNHAVELVGK